MANGHRNSRRLVLATFFVGAVLAPFYAHAQKSKRILSRHDQNNDGKISTDEWSKSVKKFKRIDANGDGFLNQRELDTFFGTEPPKQRAQGTEVVDEVDFRMIDQGTKIASRASSKTLVSRERGLLESTLVPHYAENYRCPKIDHIFGEPWRGPVAHRIHTGADIPTGWNVPIYAMAAGEVVAKFTGKKGYRGLQVVLRHAPKDTGLSGWLYTLYSHFNKMPKLNIGQRVKKGDYLGPNGKTGVPGRKRPPHLHLTVMYSAAPAYAIVKEHLFPMDAQFIDPVALFVGGMPIDTNAMRALPDGKKDVQIAYKLPTGEVFPPDAKIIWPFACE